MVLGVAQAVGARAFADLADSRRALGVPRRAGAPAERVLPAHEGLMTLKVERSTRESRFFAAFLALGLAALAALPLLRRAGRRCGSSARWPITSRWRSSGTCSRAMPGSSRSASRRSSASAAIRSTTSRASSTCIRSWRWRSRRRSRRRSRCRWRSPCSVCAAPISPSAPGSWRRFSRSRRQLVQPLGAGSGMSLTPAIVRQISPDRAGRELIVYWLALAIAAIVVAAMSIFCCARATASRSPRSAIPSPRRKASASTRSARSSWSMS